MITVFSKNNCMQCKMTKRYLEAHNISFEEINIDDHPEKIPWLKKQGFKSLPVVIKENTEAIVGFSPDRLKALAS